MLLDVHKAYMAGIIDGEGCIAISKRMPPGGVSPSYRTELIISQNNEAFLHALRALWGGAVHKVGKGAGYALRMAAEDSAACLTACLPYLMMKQEQAQILLDLYVMIKAPRGARLNDEDVAARQALFMRMKALHQGKHPSKFDPG